MDSNTIVSFYIPHMNVIYTKEMVGNVFDTLFIGIKISRIDFVSIINYSDNSVNKNYKSAFIHMYMQCRSHSKELYYTAIIAEKPFKLILNSIDSYWLLLKNKNPVPETELNISQVVENARLLEERMINQEEIIKYQTSKLIKIENVVYQLLGGLFNQSTQENILHSHLDDLLDDGANSWKPLYDNDKCKWIDWPTTRQGDYCERRIETLEKELNMLKQMANQNDDNSTHSSMPELISISDEDEDEDEDDNNSICSYTTHSSMPSLVESVNDESDSSREKRIKISDELCGNN